MVVCFTQISKERENNFILQCFIQKLRIETNLQVVPVINANLLL